jgi:hypothetical protein
MLGFEVFTSQKTVRGLKTAKIIHLVTLLSVYLFCEICLTNVYAASISAKNCSYTDVQNAVNSASRGDTVTIPAGSCNWSSALNITKALTLKGAGVGNTNISSNLSSDYLISYIPSSASNDSNVLFRITGFTFDFGNNNTRSGIRIENNGTSYPNSLNKIRIDNNSFKNLDFTNTTNTGFAIVVRGLAYGVIDNNTFEGDIRISLLGIQGTSYGRLNWDNEVWAFGSANNIYIEDNTFNQTKLNSDQYISSGWGGKYVVRYNQFNQVYPHSWKNGFDSHGNNIGIRAAFGYEAYGNKFTAPDNCVMSIADCRGGKCLVFYNRVVTATNTLGQIHLREELADKATNVDTKTFCPSGTLYSGTFTCGMDGKPQHVSHTYFFNNRYGTTAGAGRLIAATIDNNPSWANGLVENTDFFDDNGSCTASICSSGVGCGSDTPMGTCTTGTAYWKADQSCSEVPSGSIGKNPSQPISGTLYRCGQTNKWTPYFTPYTYPHPLREGEGETINAPKGFKILS